MIIKLNYIKKNILHSNNSLCNKKLNIKILSKIFKINIMLISKKSDYNTPINSIIKSKILNHKKIGI
jgi:hypothetical protein